MSQKACKGSSPPATKQLPTSLNPSPANYRSATDDDHAAAAVSSGTSSAYTSSRSVSPRKTSAARLRPCGGANGPATPSSRRSTARGYGRTYCTGCTMARQWTVFRIGSIQARRPRPRPMQRQYRHSALLLLRRRRSSSARFPAPTRAARRRHTRPSRRGRRP